MSINIFIRHYPVLTLLETPMRTLDIHLELGQQIYVGKSKKPAEITKIEYHEKSGEVTINTTAGPRSVFTFSLKPPRQGYRFEY